LEYVSAKNYENLLTHVKVKSKDDVGTFIETPCSKDLAFLLIHFQQWIKTAHSTKKIKFAWHAIDDQVPIIYREGKSVKFLNICAQL